MKRHAVALALCLLGGAVITLLIAWTLALFVDVYARWPRAAMSQYGDWHLQVTRHDGVGSVRLFTGWYHNEYPGVTSGLPWSAGDLVPRWSGLREPPSDGLVVDWRLIDARGWPWIAFSCDVIRGGGRTKDDSEVREVVGGLRAPLPDWDQSRAWGGGPPAPSPRVLPYRPVWGGFIANTLLYALLVWIAFVARPQVIARRRNRRGLCVKCAYPRGTSPVCTECGNPV